MVPEWTQADGAVEVGQRAAPHWPVCLACLLSSRSVRDLISKQQKEGLRNDTWGCSLALTNMHIHVHVRVRARTHTLNSPPEKGTIFGSCIYSLWKDYHLRNGKHSQFISTLAQYQNSIYISQKEERKLKIPTFIHSSIYEAYQAWWVLCALIKNGGNKWLESGSWTSPKILYAKVPSPCRYWEVEESLRCVAQQRK